MPRRSISRNGIVCLFLLCRIVQIQHLAAYQIIPTSICFSKLGVPPHPVEMPGYFPKKLGQKARAESVCSIEI
jgi:hypothetical protein